MNPALQRIAIHKICGKNVIGWKFDYITYNGKRLTSPTYVDEELAQYWAYKEKIWSKKILKILSFESADMCPDYLNDLNAANKAENDLIDTDSMHKYGDVAYFFELEKICGCKAAMIRATAAQRTKALLKMRKLWEE